MQDERFPKAALLHIQFSKPVRIGKKLYLRPIYNRMANASRLSIPFLCVVIIWRRAWLPHVAFQKGWDSCWREMNGLRP